jgi:hypothetical protein
VRNNALLRNKIDNLVVPLACSVDYLGLRFECLGMLPSTTNSLAYGSDLNAVLFKDDDAEAEEIAQEIGRILNLKPHYIRERST